MVECVPTSVERGKKVFTNSNKSSKIFNPHPLFCAIMKFTCLLLPLTVTGLTFKATPKQVLKNGLATATLAAAFVASPVFAADIGNGESIFDANCAACHAGGQNVIMPEKTLQKDALTSYLAGGMKEASVVTQVTNGKNAMPAFGGRLDDSDISDVAAYVIDQAANDKWE
ncbi:hypothetical protein ScalyP_jg931 [Parmales sp. scaly parma]|nr:hypothetical protein ScalyP_jg931 [Parmales sp. scaly parma]